MALSLWRMPESIAIPCSVKANGNFRAPPHLDVTICDFKILNSSFVSWNIKSFGNRFIFLSIHFSEKRGFVVFHSHGSNSRFLTLSGGCYVWRINYLTLNEKTKKINDEISGCTWRGALLVPIFWILYTGYWIGSIGCFISVRESVGAESSLQSISI